MLACRYTVEHARFKIPSFSFFPFSFFPQCHPFPWMLFQHPTPLPNWLWNGILPLFPMAISHTILYDGSSNLRTVIYTDTITAPKVGKLNAVVLKCLGLLPARAHYWRALKPEPWFTMLLGIAASTKGWVYCCHVHNRERERNKLPLFS